jgi:hypothetical protein
MKIGLEGYPFYKKSHRGPYVFMKRLSESIHKQNLSLLRITLLPFYDIGLFKVTSKNKYNLPFMMRIDGIYIDKNNTKGVSDVLNKNNFDLVEQAIGVIFISNYSKKIVEKLHKEINVPNIVIHNAVNKRLGLCQLLVVA